MTPDALNDLCEQGQERLMATDYLRAEAILADAEHHAWGMRDWDTLARLYMPLQEARRQRRQRCGDGTVRLDLVAEGPDDHVDARRVVENYPHGQLLVAGWGTLRPAVELRELQAKHGLYVETFLAAAFPIEAGGQPAGRAVAVVPLPDVQLPDPDPMPLDELLRLLPPHSIVRNAADLPHGSRRGNTETYGEVMGVWEQLHLPFLASADAEPDLVRRMEGYRRTVRVDYACELAHQKLSAVAHALVRQAQPSNRPPG